MPDQTVTIRLTADGRGFIPVIEDGEMALDKLAGATDRRFIPASAGNTRSAGRS